MHTTQLLQGVDLIYDYFPQLSQNQKEQFSQLAPLYYTWNQRINVISKKDIHHLYLHHVLHSLSLAKIIHFLPHTNILDLGTGGGFPGIPLAILFPDTHFTLVDSIAKKIKVASAIVKSLQLKNVALEAKRVESMIGRKYDFIVTRAVTTLSRVHQWTYKMIAAYNKHTIPNGVLCFKGGDLSGELASIPAKHHIYSIDAYFKEYYFSTKKIIHFYSAKKPQMKN
ncbi:MAG: 16S rRNA (guanine(527)-N(7))-methyltransferase RsmG [Bacteroidota bacterium]